MDRLIAMQVFAEVAATGSFTATAERLDMSRAMVTRHIHTLEQWLGARLLHRTTRRVTLTDAGEQCLRRSQQMLALMDNVQEETASRDGTLHGQLRLTCSMSLATAQLAAALSDFLDLHPRLKVDLNVSEGALNLVEARVDLAIRISDAPDAVLVARPLAPCASVLVASPAYLARCGQPTAPAELAQHRCLAHANFGKTEWVFSQGEQVVPVRVTTHFSANDACTLMQAALTGGGLAVLPRYLVLPSLAAGTLQVVLPPWQVPALTIYALYPSRRHLSPAVRALLDFLVLRFAALAW